MEILTLVIVALGSLLSFWAISLIVRALAELAEMRAQRRRARLAEEQTVASDTADVADPTGSPAPPPYTFKVNRLRNNLVFALAPVAFALGIAVCWAALGLGKPVAGLAWIEKIGVLSIVLGITQVQIAAACACVGWWFDPSKGRRRCPRCWYDMAGHASRQCPECGREPMAERAFYRTRRKPGLLWLAAILAITVHMSVKAPTVGRSGMFALVPSTLLIATLEYWPSEAILATVPGMNSANSVRANLQSRFDNRELFQWQERWMRHRAQTLIGSSTDPGVLSRAVVFTSRSALSLPDDAIENLCRMLGSDDAAQRRLAATILGSLEIANTRDPEQLERWSVIARRCADDVARSILDFDSDVALMAAAVASHSPTAADPYIQQVLAGIESDTSRGRQRARLYAFVLASLTRSSQTAFDLLMALLGSEDADVRRVVIRSTWLAREFHNDVIIERLTAAMEDPSDLVAADATWALASFVKSEPLARAAVAQALGRQSEQNRFLWAVPILLLGRGPEAQSLPPWLLEALAGILADPERYGYVRMAAVEVLERYPDGATSVVPSLKALIDERVLVPDDQEHTQRVLEMLEARASGDRGGAVDPLSRHQ